MRSCPTQEDPLPQFLASVYAQNHALMRLNSNSITGFENGTVQGSRWYTLLGGMQVGYAGLLILIYNRTISRHLLPHNA
jgi:hypothetical protein